jgi:hypothetical protein
LPYEETENIMKFKAYTYMYHPDGQLATANNERADANRSTVGRGDPTAPDEFKKVLSTK